MTKRSLAGLGGILFMGLIGLMVAMVLNLFLASTAISWVVSIVGVVIFTALTAYDVQRIGAGDLAAMTGSMEKAAVIGALRLYLDFINLFLFMLRLVRRTQLTEGGATEPIPQARAAGGGGGGRGGGRAAGAVRVSRSQGRRSTPGRNPRRQPAPIPRRPR